MLVLKNYDEINYYINISITQNLSYRELHNKIKSNEYERLDDNARNKLIENEEKNIGDFIKHPIVIKNIYDTSLITERMLKNAILENVDDFLKELGNGFTYVGSEYKIKLGYRYNYIDMLLFNIEFKCYVGLN